MGGRGGSSGIVAKGNQVAGIKGSVQTTWKEVSNSSPNDIWATSKPHAVLKNEQGTVQVRGEKTDRYALLNSVNTAVVHIDGIDTKNPSARDIAKINRSISEIKSMGFDTPLINISFSETVIFAKRKRFTKNF